MSFSQICFQILIAILILLLSFFLLWQLSFEKFDYKSITVISGLNRLKEPEIYAELDHYFRFKFLADAKNTNPNNAVPALSFFEINPIEINRFLTKNPLIKNVRMRRYLFPRKHIHLYVNEEQPWASYKGQVISDNGEKVSNFSAELLDLIDIKSQVKLEDEDILTLREIGRIIENAFDQPVKAVEVDREKNVFFQVGVYKFKLGLLNKQVLERAERVNLIQAKLLKIEEELSSRLEYVDLSLATPEIILGKKGR